MNNLCVDIGWKSINHVGEELCGDHVDIIEAEEDSFIVVLADGLGSGVKACILSTLTSKIISTMMSEGLPLEDCVSTIAATLPICSERGVAYSTFTIMHIEKNNTVEIIQYDNPHVILLRNGKMTDYQKQEINLDGKRIFKSMIRFEEGDVFIAMSDGCPHAGIGTAYNFGWKSEDIADFMLTFTDIGYTAKTLATMLVDECNKQYGYEPGDDATACVVKVRKRNPVNLLFGPPENRDDCNMMMSLFFSKEGKHIICGGTTSSIAAKYLGKPLKATLNFENRDVPPIAEIEGVDLVTEGVITISKVIEYAKDALGENTYYSEWSIHKDGASRICRLLFEDATDINFFIGRSVNPAHQNPDLPITFNIKMNLVEELTAYLQDMGKRVKVSFF